MTKGENGIWSGTTLRRVKPGVWRYTFNVDGATVVDSRNVNVSPNQTQVQSVLYVPGDFSETRDVPHGTVGLVRYVATTLGNARREMYVYTPPGYEKGTERQAATRGRTGASTCMRWDLRCFDDVPSCGASGMSPSGTNSHGIGYLEMAQWIKAFVPEVPVQLVKAGELFWTPK
jgi:hypothetical protein